MCQKILDILAHLDTFSSTKQKPRSYPAVMSNATYESRFNRWTLIYKKPSAKGTYIYGKKRIGDRGQYKTLGKREQNKLQHLMDARAKQLEAEAMGQKVEDKAVQPAAEYFKEGIKQYCSSNRLKAIKEATFIANLFGDWLAAHHPASPLAEITRGIAREYTDYLIQERKYSTDTAKQHLKRLTWLFKRKEMLSPFVVKELLADYKRNEYTFQREHFFPEDFKIIIDQLVAKGDAISFQVFAALYLGITTSWRKSDIVCLKWSQFNMDRRTITVTHSKTARSTGRSTTIPLTDIGFEIMRKLQQLNGSSKYAFCFTRRRMTDQEKSNKGVFQYKADLLFEDVRKARNDKKVKRKLHDMNRLTFHSLRGTASTHLLMNGYTEALTQSMSGHAPDTIERKHYIQLDGNAFKDAVKALEDEFIAPHFKKYGKTQVPQLYKGIVQLVHKAESPTERKLKELKKKLEAIGFYELTAGIDPNVVKNLLKKRPTK